MNTRNFSKATEAVSPVVATLLLVLVAAGAAIGFGVFLNGFQKDTQENVSGEAPTQVLTIGGSSTVYEFTAVAMDDFMSVHPSVKIDLQSGGSGAGRAAVCKGFIDIGSSSSSWKDADYDACTDNLHADLQVVEVAKDALVMVTGSGNTQCTTLQFTKAQVTALYNRNGRTTGATGQSIAYPAFDGTFTAITAGSARLTWADLATAGSCIGGTDTTAVLLGARSDPGGTEDGFRGAFGLTGTSDGQLDDTVYTNLVNSDGNQGIESWLASTPLGLSFIGFGHYAANTADFNDIGTLDGIAPSISTIKGGTYPSYAVRSLTYGTAGAPSALEQLFLDFVLNTHNNQIFSTEAGYISIY